jgi:acyl-CoA reductase-like NAD-dependent aldehyde dehydrogenase
MSFRHPDISALPRSSLIIGGQRAEKGSGDVHSHIYPGTGRVTRELVLGNAADVDAAVAAARAAFPAWRALPGDKRRDLMFRLAALCEQHMQELGLLSTIENGAVTTSAPFHAYDAAQKFRYCGGWADKIQGQTVATWGAPAHDYVAYEPYGVIGALIPWNGPLYAATMVAAPALAAGNCMVLKAPELAPWTVLRLGELIVEAGFPEGVVNIIAGGADVGEAMVAHPGIDKIQFVGSGAVAKKVLKNAAETLKPCGLELGGKSAVIVFDDADLADATRRGLSGAVSANGQGCVIGTRLLVQKRIYDEFLESLAAAASKVVVGDPFEKATGLGPVISEASLQRILGVISCAKEEGGHIVTGGARLDGDHAGGFFLPVTIIAGISNDSAIAQQEVFGPVLAAIPFDTEDEAIALANGTAYGLGGYIHTQNLRRAHYVASQLDAGQVQVNASGEAMTACVPFGGVKQSGYGRLGGEAGVHEFLRIKNIYVNLNRLGDAL